MVPEFDRRLALLPKAWKPTILILEDIDRLLRQPRAMATAAALRASLVKRPGDLRIIFTGSSPSHLHALFHASRAPFHGFAAGLELPLLGDELVDHGLSMVGLASPRRLARGPLLAAFEALERQPGWFRALLHRLVLVPGLDMAIAIAEVRTLMAEQAGYPLCWQRLSLLQRGLCWRMARGDGRPFGGPARAELARLTGQPLPTTGQVQAALRKLQRDGLVEPELDGWGLADPGFAAWIRTS